MRNRIGEIIALPVAGLAIAGAACWGALPDTNRVREKPEEMYFGETTRTGELA